MKTLVFVITSLCTYFINQAPQLSNPENSVFTVSENFVPADEREDDEPVILNCHLKRPNGTPCQGASVELYVTGEATPVHSGTTNSDGTVTFPSVVPRNYRYKVSATGYQEIDKTITVLTVNTTLTDTLVSN